MATKLTENDKRVIHAFINRQSFSGKRFHTDGKRLDILALGGRGVAEWIREKIHFRDLGGLFEQTVHRYLQKNVPRNWLGTAERDPSKSRRQPGYPPYPRGKAKIRKVMEEFESGKLRSSSGRKVTNIRQARAIALSEQRRQEHISCDPVRDARRTPKKKALAALERAWVQHLRGGARRAAHGGNRVHDTTLAAYRAGATEREVHAAMDRAAKLTENQRRTSVWKRLAELRRIKAKGASPRERDPDMRYVRKTKDEYVVQGNYGYGHGWEDVTAANTRLEILQYLKEYRLNEPGVFFRIRKRRVPR